MEKTVETSDEEESDEEEEAFTKAEIKKSVKKPMFAGNNCQWHPHEIVTQCENKDGIRFCTVVVALTGGTAEDKSMDGVTVVVSDEGREIIVQETWSCMLNNMELFHGNFDKSDDIHEQDNLEDFILCKVAMKATVRKMKEMVGGDVIKSIHNVRLPFKVDPTSLKVNFVGTDDGCRCVHVDLCEQKKVQTHSLKMMNELAPKVTPSKGNDKCLPAHH